jgi:hypothetical protein
MIRGWQSRVVAVESVLTEGSELELSAHAGIIVVVVSATVVELELLVVPSDVVELEEVLVWAPTGKASSPPATTPVIRTAAFNLRIAAMSPTSIGH